MAKITRIKAKDPTKPKEKKTPELNASKEPTKKELRLAKEVDKKLKKEKERKSNKKPFVLFRPFIALGKYLKESWQELRQVRWPNRKAAWKMVLAIFVYTAIFVAFLVLVNILFDLLFNKLLS